MQTKATIARGCVAGYPITINFRQSAKTMLSMLQSAAPTGTAGAGGPGANGGGGVTGDPGTVGSQSVMRVTTPAQARALRGPTDPAERRRASAVFYRPKAYRARARLPIGQHDRMEEYLLADGRVCASDGAAQRRHLPIHLKSVRLRELRLRAGEIADFSSV